MTARLPSFELLALRYATRQISRNHQVLGGDPHDAPARLDYYVWCIRSQERVVLVDTGFSPEMGRQRKRDMLIPLPQLLERADIDPAEIDDVIITHLHYDHAGNLSLFPNARFHIQDVEVAYATGRYMASERPRHAYEVEDVVAFVRLVYGERVQFHDGAAVLFPGISLHRIGGHTSGLQCVRVQTARGWVVLASDTAHFYENFRTGAIFPTVFNIGEVLDGYRTLHELAESQDHIVPGHDPLVMSLYPSAGKKLEGLGVRLDATPLPHPHENP